MGKLTEQDLLDVMKKMKGHKNPDTLVMNKEWGDAFSLTIYALKTMGGSIEVSYGKEIYKLKLTQPKQRRSKNG